MADGAGAVTMAPVGLRPKAEGAPRFAAAPGVKRHIGMLEIAAEISLNIQVTLVDRRDEGQVVHVFEDRTVRRVLDLAVGVPAGEAKYGLPVPAVGDFLDGEIKFIARGEIHDRRGFQGFFGVDRRLGADQPDFQRRIGVLESP